MITFCTLMGALRTEFTKPVNTRPGYASTVNVAVWSTRTRPTSASETFVSTCIFVRSWAIRNSVGAARLAATVCPTSTFRETTTPSTGALMLVWSRSIWAVRRAAPNCFTCAWLAVKSEFATFNCACATFTLSSTACCCATSAL